MDRNCLGNTSNSPPLSVFHHEKRRRQITSLWSSEESFCISLTEVKDDIFNAEQVTSEERAANDTDGKHPSFPRPQIDPLISSGQRNTLEEQAASYASELVAAATEGHKDKKTHIGKGMLKNDRNARLRYSEPLPNCPQRSSIDDQLRPCKSLDCLKSGHDAFMAQESWFDRHTSSSEEAHASIICTFLFPLSPCRPPVVRRSTPPGLPAFGTREAQELRLTPASQSNLSNIGRRLLRYINDEDPSSRPRGGDDSSPTPIEAHRPHTNIPADILKRMLGIARPVSLPVGPYEPGRSKLPKGVKIVATAGPLIQADDGTFVRGRWGPRTSGHGIGQRTIGVHPFAQLRGSSTIDEAVREIDKAHERMQERARSVLPRHLPLPSGPSEASNTRVHSPNGRTISSCPSQTPPIPNLLSVKRTVRSGHSSMPTESLYRMDEPNQYSVQTRPIRGSVPSGLVNSHEGSGGRSPDVVKEKRIATNLLQTCWEWTCRPCNQIFFPGVVSKS